MTAAATVLAARAGLGIRTLLVMLAVGSGQLSIGWSNDWLDRHRDRATARADKPLAAGEISERAVAAAASAAAAICVVASLALGPPAAAAHLTGVCAGWFYNVRAKHTWYSVAPWALAFGLLPAVVTLTEPLGRWPAGWLVAAGALLGAGAHFANAIPDLAADRATGVEGLPHRLGRRRSLTAALGMVAVGNVIVVASLGVRSFGVVVGVLGSVLLIAVAAWVRSGHDRFAFRGVVALLLLLAASVFASGAALF